MLTNETEQRLKDLQANSTYNAILVQVCKLMLATSSLWVTNLKPGTEWKPSQATLSDWRAVPAVTLASRLQSLSWERRFRTTMSLSFQPPTDNSSVENLG